MSPDGPVEPAIVSALYPAGPNWWLGPDDLWHPPPEPPEPPGTTHRVGERKRTWQGTVEWSGSSWKLLDDAVAYAHPVTAAVGVPPDRHERRSRTVAISIIVVAAVLSLSRFFPVTVGTASCSQNQLASPQWVTACSPNFTAVYHYSYSWWNLSTTYDPWFNPLSPNGKEVLFYFAAIASVLWAWRVLRVRSTKRRMRIGAYLIFTLIVTADALNVVQLSRFNRQWRNDESICGYLACTLVVERGAVVLTLGLSIALVLLLLLSLSTLDDDEVDRRAPSAVPSTSADAPSAAVPWEQQGDGLRYTNDE